jgi:hypothetical protein
VYQPVCCYLFIYGFSVSCSFLHLYLPEQHRNFAVVVVHFTKQLNIIFLSKENIGMHIVKREDVPLVPRKSSKKNFRVTHENKIKFYHNKIWLENPLKNGKLIFIIT